MTLKLSLAIARNVRTKAVIDGTVAAEAIELTPTVLFPSEIFWRQLRFADFDLSEFSFSELLTLAGKEDRRWVGLPIFTTHRFFHTGILVRRDRGIERPEDLRGKQLGVPEYGQTAALWTRGILQHEFGVSPRDITFWMERNPDRSHAAAMGLEMPAGVTVNQIPHEKNIGSMVASGEIDGTLLYIRNTGSTENMVDRSTIDLSNHPDVKTLFPDPVAEGIRYFEKTGLFPINHGMAIRREIAEENPWVLLNIYAAFQKANEIANAERMQHVDYYLSTGLLGRDARGVLRTPLVQHGIAANRDVLETAATFSYEQGLTPERVTLDRVFAPSLLDT